MLSPNQIIYSCLFVWIQLCFGGTKFKSVFFYNSMDQYRLVLFFSHSALITVVRIETTFFFCFGILLFAKVNRRVCEFWIPFRNTLLTPYVLHDISSLSATLQWQSALVSESEYDLSVTQNGPQGSHEIQNNNFSPLRPKTFKRWKKKKTYIFHDDPGLNISENTES